MGTDGCMCVCRRGRAGERGEGAGVRTGGYGGWGAMQAPWPAAPPSTTPETHMPMQPMPMQPMPMPSRPAPMLPLPPPQGNMKGNIPAWTGPIPEDATVTQTPGSQFPTYTWKATQPGGYTTTHWYSGPLGPDRVPPNFDSPSIPHLPSIPVTF